MLNESFIGFNGKTVTLIKPYNSNAMKAWKSGNLIEKWSNKLEKRKGVYYAVLRAISNQHVIAFIIRPLPGKTVNLIWKGKNLYAISRDGEQELIRESSTISRIVSNLEGSFNEKIIRYSDNLNKKIET